LHRTVTGEWVWSSEEEDSGASTDDEDVKETLPVNTIENASSDEETGEPDEYYGQIRVVPSQIALQASEQNVPINLVLRLRYRICFKTYFFHQRIIITFFISYFLFLFFSYRKK